jgi:hypothetical protein
MLKQRDMQAANSSFSTGSLVSKVIFVIVILVVLYYLYQFLYGSSAMVGTVVLNAINNANPTTPYVTPSAPTKAGSSTSSGPTVPAIYEGGEFSINTWFYINDYSINRGQNKHVLELGGSSFSTLVLFLGPYKNSLSVRVQTSSPSRGASSGNSYLTGDQNVDLTVSSVRNMFTSLQSESTLLENNVPCDISTVDMQKWVQATVVLNNKTCDVYIDGKLARSCVLPSFYRVDKSNFQLIQCNYNGFGGYVSNTSAYNYSLNPEQVWRLYMTGPGPQYTFGQYVASLFNPNSNMTFGYPKQNITG